MSDRQLLLVVGIGRSGTSLFTGIVGQLGLHVPQPEVRADDTNPRGLRRAALGSRLPHPAHAGPENHRVRLAPGCLGARR